MARRFPGLGLAGVEDPATRRTFDELDIALRGLLGERLVAQWTETASMPNVTTSFRDVYTGTGVEGKPVSVDFSGATRVTAEAQWQRSGTDTGIQDLRAVDADDTGNVLFTLTEMQTGRNVRPFTTIPGFARGRVRRIKLQARSSVGSDDPFLHFCAIRVE